ncbi:uncharacterized protein LTR77_001989 [Saxophila tyrrhenica]|uniref:Uncharacterized protein n=1 Tax=Saxophila tyrrhenica TaxID=1690608 RepID=A0AAV9PKU4_9PEZI|nr:hypothetical protein LTR77_001989 [Saxophila tyrrhenica]
MAQAPSTTNPSYFTGLDTWSASGASSTRQEVSGEYARVSEGGTTVWDPPPPYRYSTSTAPGEGGGGVAPRYSGGQVSGGMGTGFVVERSPFDDPEDGDEHGGVGDGVVDGHVQGQERGYGRGYASGDFGGGEDDGGSHDGRSYEGEDNGRGRDFDADDDDDALRDPFADAHSAGVSPVEEGTLDFSTYGSRRPVSRGSWEEDGR